MSIRKVMMMFALMTGIVCAGHAQEVKNDSTATTKAEELKLVKDVCPQTEEDGDLYHGLTKKLMFDRFPTVELLPNSLLACCTTNDSCFLL